MPGLCFFWSCQIFGQTTQYCHNYSHIPKKFHNVLAMPKTQKTCIVGTTPPMKSNPMACGLGWGQCPWPHGAMAMLCMLHDLWHAHGCVLWQPFWPKVGGGQTSKFHRLPCHTNLFGSKHQCPMKAQNIFCGKPTVGFCTMDPPTWGTMAATARTHGRHKSCNMQSIAIALCTPCGHDPSPALKPLDWVLLGVLCQPCTFFVFL